MDNEQDPADMKELKQVETSTPRRFGRAAKSHFNPARGMAPALLPFRLIGTEEAPDEEVQPEETPPSQITWTMVH